MRSGEENLMQTWKKNQNIARRFVGMNLKKCPKRSIDEVGLTDSSMKDLDGILTAFHVDNFGAETIQSMKLYSTVL